MPSGGDHRTLTSLSQCAICFSVITTDMQPRQCSGCRNSLYCGNCVSQYANQCPVCKDSQVQFIPIHTQLRKILDSIRFRCRRSNASATCTAETEGRNFRINQHNYIECPLLEDTGFDQNREFTIQTVRDKDQRMCDKHKDMSASKEQFSESATSKSDFAYKKIILDLLKANA